MTGDPSQAHVRLDALAGIQPWSDWWELKSRTLMLFDEVIGGGGLNRRGQKDLQMAVVTPVEFFVSALLFFDSESHDPIRILINSPGGDIISGLALIQVMRDIESPIHTVVVGEAVSMAAVIAVAGDRRLAYPQARWLLHRGRGRGEGDAEDLAIAAKELETLDGYADYIVTRQTKIPPEKLKRFQRKDFWVGTPEALKYGLIDEVIQPRKGPKDWLPDRAFLKRRLKEKEEEEIETEEEGGKQT